MSTVHQNTYFGVALIPQAVGTSAVSGTTIVRPWEKGRNLTFLLQGGVFGADDEYTVKVYARRIGTTTWDQVEESDETTGLAFTATDMVDGEELENGILMGTMDVSRFVGPDSAYIYDALKLLAVNTDNTTPGIIGASYVISDLYNNNETQTDDLLYKQLPYTA
jgi:hypothetical protein